MSRWKSLLPVVILGLVIAGSWAITHSREQAKSSEEQQAQEAPADANEEIASDARSRSADSREDASRSEVTKEGEGMDRANPDAVREHSAAREQAASMKGPAMVDPAEYGPLYGAAAGLKLFVGMIASAGGEVEMVADEAETSASKSVEVR